MLHSIVYVWLEKLLIYIIYLYNINETKGHGITSGQLLIFGDFNAVNR